MSEMKKTIGFVNLQYQDGTRRVRVLRVMKKWGEEFALHRQYVGSTSKEPVGFSISHVRSGCTVIPCICEYRYEAVAWFHAMMAEKGESGFKTALAKALLKVK